MSTALNRLARLVWPNGLVFLGYLILALVMTWPLLTRLGTALAGEGTDLWIHQWTFWWVKQALLNGQSLFYTTLLYYPQGVSLTSHNIAWFNIALWLPLQALLGSVTAYNLIFILVLTLNGFAFYLFARAETSATAAAAVGGIIVGFWPYTFSHYDHPNMMVTFWVPLTLYFLLRTFRRQRVLDAVLAGVSLAMIGISRWQMLVMSAPILLAYTLYLIYREPTGRTARSARLFLFSAFLGALLMVPLAAPLVFDQLGRSGPEAVAVGEPGDDITDLFAYVAPPDLYRLIWGDMLDQLPDRETDIYERIEAGARYVPYIGLITLALAVYGLWRRWSETWFWLLVALGIILMALGPELVINGQRFPQVPMPYRALSGSLLDVLVRSPHRLNIFLSIPMAMMATWGMADLFSRLAAYQVNDRGRLLTALASAFLGALILWDNPIPPLPTTNTAVPQWYQNLAQEEEAFALLEIPFHNRGFDKLYMFYQTVHGKPLLVGHVSRLPQQAFQFLDGVPFLQPFNSIYKWDIVDESWVDPSQGDVTRQLRLLSDAGVRYIVLNKPLVAAGYLERWRDWVTFDPAYEDEEVLVYTTSPQAGKEFDTAHQIADGIGIMRGTVAPMEGNQGGVIKADIRWVSSADPQEVYEVCFFLRSDQGDTTTTMCKDLVAGWPTSDWQAHEVARGLYIVPISKQLKPGKYQVDIALVKEGEQAPAGETLRIAKINVSSYAPEQDVSLCWTGSLCLSGYDKEQNLDQLDLTLYWQAEATADRSFKRFAHLVDTHDGRVAAQSDAVPRDWTYPTNIWEPNEVIVDRLSLALDGLPPATYELRVGWYAADGGEMLAACHEGDCSGDEAVYHVLQDVIIPPEP